MDAAIPPRSSPVLSAVQTQAEPVHDAISSCRATLRQPVVGLDAEGVRGAQVETGRRRVRRVVIGAALPGRAVPLGNLAVRAGLRQLERLVECERDLAVVAAAGQPVARDHLGDVAAAQVDRHLAGLAGNERCVPELDAVDVAVAGPVGLETARERLDVAVLVTGEGERRQRRDDDRRRDQCQRPPPGRSPRIRLLIVHPRCLLDPARPSRRWRASSARAFKSP